MTTLVPGDYAMVATSPSPEYASSLEAVAPNITQLVAEQNGGGESWVDTLSRLLPALAATYQQKQILAVQVERAKQGLPPLDANQIAAGVNVGVSGDTQRFAGYVVGAVIAAALLIAFAAPSRR